MIYHLNDCLKLRAVNINNHYYGINFETLLLT